MIIMIGQIVSHYEILEKLGEGGMGIVYKAHDTKLNRTVALKFLHPDLTRIEEAKQRFIVEAQAASALDHNNICNIHEIDETTENQIFICMAFYEGSSLKTRIENKSLSPNEIYDIAIQIAQGLKRAHQAGMIHRDIKPGNIMITEDGIVKIVDFGLAKLQGQTTLTRAGATPGTVAYMSPERLEGEEVDERTDIWSYGILLYEMITGELPFKGDSEQAIIYSIVTNSLDTQVLEQANAPPFLISIIKKCLEKNPAHRYHSFAQILKVFTKELSDYLQLTPAAIPLFSTESLINLFRRNKIPVYITTLVVIVAILIRIYLFPGNPSLKSVSIIVADFENFTNQRVFDNSLSNGLQTSLRQSDYINILPTYKINQSIRRMELPDEQRLDRNTALAIAARENIPVAITASIDQLGASYLLTANIIEVTSGDIIKQQRVSVPHIEDVLAGIDKLVNLIRKDLGESTQLINKTSKPLAQVTTSSLEALEYYSQGIEFARFGKYQEAIEVEEKAVELDSTFVMAIHSLSYNYQKVGNHKKAIYFHNKILPLLDRVTEKEKYSILRMYYGPDFERDYDKAYYYAKLLVEKYPKDGVGLANLAHLAMRVGDYKTALEYSQKAMEIDTIFSGTCYNNIAFTYALMGDTDNALKYFKISKNIRPNFMEIDFYLAQTFWIMGELDSSEAVFQSLIPRANNAYRIRIHSYLACLYYYRGMIKKAENQALLGVGLCQQENRLGDEAYFDYLLSEIYRVPGNSLNKQKYYSRRAIDLSESPFWEIALTAIAYAKMRESKEAAKLMERLKQINTFDPVFKKDRVDMINYVQAIGSIHENDLPRALLHLQQIKKHVSGDPFYWLAQKEIGEIRVLMGDSTALSDFREILGHRGEIILGSLGGVRRSGFWSSWLIPELLATLGKHYLQKSDTSQAVYYLSEAQHLWHGADEEYLRAREISRILSELE